MSLLVKIMQEPALVDGEVKEIGEPARVPNSIAVGWKKKGRAIDANDQDYLDEAKLRTAKQAHAQTEIEKREKGNKGRR